MSTLSRPHPGVDKVKALCDPESLTAFAWELFQHGDDLGFVALGLLGDDGSARRIGPLIKAWPGEGHHAMAVKGLDVLAAIGGEVALTELDGISRKAKFKALKARAQEKLAEVADRLGLSTEQLADRLVPDLGLDAGGGLVLDYGPRRFTVGFDEHLRPFVADEDGTRRKTLPKPGVRDDATLAPRAYERFTRLKKDVRALASGQVARLELAMVMGRQWSPREFEALFVRHPLMWHIARRLVWTSGGTAFRLAEDRTCADVHDDAVEPGEMIAVAHPFDLGDDLDSWTRVFADYELLQPFKQLGRAVHTLTDEERATGRLKRFEGTATTAYKVWGLVRRGWERGAPQDNGVEVWISRPLPGDRHIVANLHPGIVIDDPFAWPDVTVTHVWVTEQPQRFQTIDMQPFDTVPPTIISEVIADLSRLSDS
ncbi:DUF4132 domain-containing protein [Spirillospora sp. CA-294931]|uniref:DUF4132 domain-containing protein n=1 Tax=Spirillospora sp. CA-294931 TaxID=3240042 RepID=UPI003D8BA603